MSDLYANEMDMLTEIPSTSYETLATQFLGDIPKVKAEMPDERFAMYHQTIDGRQFKMLIQDRLTHEECKDLEWFPGGAIVINGIKGIYTYSMMTDYLWDEDKHETSRTEHINGNKLYPKKRGNR